jgi:hypothetical protein
VFTERRAVQDTSVVEHQKNPSAAAAEKIIRWPVRALHDSVNKGAAENERDSLVVMEMQI